MTESNISSVVEHFAVGHHLRCEECGFELAVVTPCECESGAPELTCCGQPLTSAPVDSASD